MVGIESTASTAPQLYRFYRLVLNEAEFKRLKITPSKDLIFYLRREGKQ